MGLYWNLCGYFKYCLSLSLSLSLWPPFCMSHMSNYDFAKEILNFKVNCRTVLSDIEHSATVHMSQTVNVFRQTLYINTNTFLISQLHAGNDHSLAGRYGNAHRILLDFRLQSRCKWGLRSSAALHSVSSCDPLTFRPRNFLLNFSTPCI